MTTLPDRFASMLAAAAIACTLAGCGSQPDPAPAGRVAPPDPTPVTAPELAGPFEPRISDAVQAALADSDRGVRAVLHVVVHQDGTPGEVTVKSADPADHPAARGFAEDVARSLRTAHFRAATRAGRPADAEFDFAIEAEGGLQKEPAAR